MLSSFCWGDQCLIWTFHGHLSTQGVEQWDHQTHRGLVQPGPTGFFDQWKLWLVVTGTMEFSMTFPSYWDHHSNWLSQTMIFQRGRWNNQKINETMVETMVPMVPMIPMIIPMIPMVHHCHFLTDLFSKNQAFWGHLWRSSRHRVRNSTTKPCSGKWRKNIDDI